MKISFVFILISMLPLKLFTQQIHRTACQGKMASLDSMLTYTNVNVKDNRGRSLLHWAVACRQKEVFNYLLKKGIALNAEDHQKKTALHVAVQLDRRKYLDTLVQLQANKEWADKYGASLLELAVLNGNDTIIEALVNKGVDINLKNNRGSTALEISERIGSEVVSKLLISLGADKRLVRQFKMKGKYMGQEDPGITPKLFAPNFISTEEQEFGSVFNKAGTAFYFGVDVNGKSEIRYSAMDGMEWTKPLTLISHQKYGYNDPFLSNDEKRLYFISKRAIDGKGAPKDVDIWYAEKINNGWSEPIHGGTTINTSGNEYYISFTGEGTMYFSSNGHDANEDQDKDFDIYFAKSLDGEFQKPVVLDTAVNTPDYEGDVFVAPDESYLIFCSERDTGFGRGDLYISFKDTNNQWTKAVNMGSAINTEHYEYCPFVSKDGKYLFYTSNQDIYWVSTEILNDFRDTKK